MDRVVLLGAGKIGRMIARMLQSSGDYEVVVGDAHEPALQRIAEQSGVQTQLVDALDRSQLMALFADARLVISALSYRFNPVVADAAVASGISYFDLTEDIATTDQVRQAAGELKAGEVCAPQCGLAPGFISIAAQHLINQFDELDSVHMRVGALPQFPSNALKYNLTWSTDGLINEYCNLCDAIHNRERMSVLPLEGLEHFSLDGVRYEAFNTSGGLGTLCESLQGQVRELNYKTIRYLGHRELVAFLLNDLRLTERRELIKDILETAVPVTYQDVVVTFCTVQGWRSGQLVQMSDARKIYHSELDDEHWSAIQITTAASVCAVVDLFLQGQLPHDGFIRQEEIELDVFLKNRFGRRYQALARQPVFEDRPEVK